MIILHNLGYIIGIAVLLIILTAVFAGKKAVVASTVLVAVLALWGTTILVVAHFVIKYW